MGGSAQAVDVIIFYSTCLTAERLHHQQAPQAVRVATATICKEQPPCPLQGNTKRGLYSIRIGVKRDHDSEAFCSLLACRSHEGAE